MFYNYPFTAIVGQENLKKALILNVINPRIKGLLISGEKGTAKTMMVRSLAQLLGDRSVVDLPLNITEDQLIGSIDISSAIKSGEKLINYGLLKEADGNFLYIDEVNLLSQHISNIILDVSAQNMNYIEREGLSHQHPSNFVLIGTMNPEEGLLSGQLLDRFGIYLEVRAEDDLESRKEIMRRFLAYEEDPKSFYQDWQEEEVDLRARIIRAQELLPKVEINKDHLEVIARLVLAANCEGHRADLVMIETAKALAAWYGDESLTYEHIREAAFFALAHRIREDLEIELEEIEDESEDDSSQEDEDLGEEESPDLEVEEEEAGPEESRPSDEDILEDIEELKEELSLDIDFKEKTKNEGTGKRSKVRTDSRKGRYVKYRLPKKEVEDLAFHASFRMAAINQYKREKPDGLAIDMRKEDLREKVREKKTGANILFLVDSSGSMGARKRMGAVKGAVLSLLTDAYQKRDNIAIIGFREDYADIILNFTRSVDLAEKCLRKISTGGETPLAAGLERAYRLLEAEKVKNPEALQYLVLVSDGRANQALYTSDPMEDAYHMAEKIKLAGINSMVLDTESGFMRFAYAEKLAEIMDSDYVQLSKLTKAEIESNVKDLINRKK